MQFHLQSDELQLLADILLEQNSPDHEQILNKVLARDLRFDAGELEDTADLLIAKEIALKNEIAQQANTVVKEKLQPQLALLDRVLERVNEACAMF